VKSKQVRKELQQDDPHCADCEDLRAELAEAIADRDANYEMSLYGSAAANRELIALRQWRDRVIEVRAVLSALLAPPQDAATPEPRTPAEVFPPSVYILDEIRARGWSYPDLAEAMGWDLNIGEMMGVIMGTCPIAPDIAATLARAFDLDAQYWLNLQAAWERGLAAELDMGGIDETS
jgi:plasmid maintenance system antidote protein VapI